MPNKTSPRETGLNSLLSLHMSRASNTSNNRDINPHSTTQSSTLQIPQASFKQKISIKALDQLQNIIIWITNNTWKLPFSLTLSLREKITQQLNQYNSTATHTDNNLKEAFIVCKEHLKAFNESLPTLTKDIYIPQTWTANEEATNKLYTAFHLPVNEGRPHIIPGEADDVILCKAVDENVRQFGIEKESKLLDPNQAYPSAKGNSTIKLAHLLISHIQASPHSIITIERNNNDYEELIAYLYAYVDLCKVVGNPLYFTLQSKTGEAINRPSKEGISTKIKEPLLPEKILSLYRTPEVEDFSDEETYSRALVPRL